MGAIPIVNENDTLAVSVRPTISSMYISADDLSDSITLGN